MLFALLKRVADVVVEEFGKPGTVARDAGLIEVSVGGEFAADDGVTESRTGCQHSDEQCVFAVRRGATVKGGAFGALVVKLFSNFDDERA